MSIKKPEEFLRNAVVDIAENMIIAAKTAPKGRGTERLCYLLITGNELKIISHKMEEISKENNVAFFGRDAGNLLKADALVLIGASYNPRNVQLCTHCGFSCDNKPDDAPCAITMVDLGIAIGSAVSMAAHFHVDNRVMYSVGLAAIQLGLFPKEIKSAYGIPLSVSSKNIFFDRT
ncbi:MAG: hypothetical protein A2W93_15550 [Bacteroidetes bacterium GWF2_43_63]|nr:MAG: hypothetical protein A2W94_05320 [Bacteroidetes bacterium GWE2_42_42]OFY53434.1 MAG: hypothetical protein A2W93_15550 [Bacteroidetes bacterium GWF2_43_63]HBG69392.1 ferredoxin [Bacteroidales bacterium]HCB62011.1 ferredoxin [Bacteroidales bacterium]HCY23153.1 ferredoxin [Bacteroidales bacterium]